MTKAAFIVLILSSLACSFQSPVSPVSGVQAARQYQAVDTGTKSTPIPARTFSVISPVWVRTYAGEKVEAVAGGEYPGWCVGDWCYIPAERHKVWRGCTDKADGRGCLDEK